MTTDNQEGLFSAVVLGVIVGLVIAFAVVEARTDAACAKRGWSNGKVMWSFTRYCVTRINQTDVIKPLSEAEQR